MVVVDTKTTIADWALCGSPRYKGHCGQSSLYHGECAFLEISEGGVRGGGNKEIKRDVSCANQIFCYQFSFYTENKLCKNLPSVRLRIILIWAGGTGNCYFL